MWRIDRCWIMPSAPEPPKLLWKISVAMTLEHLASSIGVGLVDEVPPGYGRALGDRSRPALDMFVFLDLEELGGSAVIFPADELAIPGPYRHVGDRVFGASEERLLG